MAVSLVQPWQVQAAGLHCSAFLGKRPLLHQKPRKITLLSLSACRESWVLKFTAPSICTVLCFLRTTNPSVLSGRHDLSSLYRWSHCQKGGCGEWGITFSPQHSHGEEQAQSTHLLALPYFLWLFYKHVDLPLEKAFSVIIPSYKIVNTHLQYMGLSILMIH